MKQVVAFNTEDSPELSQVGGKGLSLILMSQQGLPVPPGFVLTVDFFKPWLETIQASAQLTAVLQSTPDRLKPGCDALKAMTTAFELTAAQQESLAGAVQALDGCGLMAVRSSKARTPYH